VTTLSVRQTIWLVVIFIVTSVGLIVIDNRQGVNPVRSGISELLLPVARLMNGVTDESDDETALQLKYDMLQSDYDQLLAQYTQLMVNAREIDELREMLNLRTTQPGLKFVPARVTYLDPTNLQKFVIIDRGLVDGIKVGMAVTDPNFYVGLVVAVDENSAKVALAIDATQSVGAELLTSGGVGIGWGMWQKGGRIELRHVPRSVSVVEGEYVVTACAKEASTANVPCGLVIGKVSGPAVQDNQSDTQYVPVTPAVDFDNLTLVAVIVAVSNEES